MRMLSVKIFAFLEPKINNQTELWVMQAAGFDKNACDVSAASILILFCLSLIQGKRV